MFSVRNVADGMRALLAHMAAQFVELGHLGGRYIHPDGMRELFAVQSLGNVEYSNPMRLDA